MADARAATTGTIPAPATLPENSLRLNGLAPVPADDPCPADLFGPPLGLAHDRFAERRYLERWGRRDLLARRREAEEAAWDDPAPPPRPSAKTRWYRSAAIARLRIDGRDKAILWYVEDAMDAEGIQACTASAETIARRVGCPVPSTRRRIAALIAAGRLEEVELPLGRLGLRVVVSEEEFAEAKAQRDREAARSPQYSGWLTDDGGPVCYASKQVPPGADIPPYQYGWAIESFRLVWRRVLAGSLLDARAKLAGRAISELADRTGDAPFRPLALAEIGRMCGRGRTWARLAVRTLVAVGLLDAEQVGPASRGLWLFRLRLPRPALDAAFRRYLGVVRVKADEDGGEGGWRAEKRRGSGKVTGPGPAAHPGNPCGASETDPLPGCLGPLQRNKQGEYRGFFPPERVFIEEDPTDPAGAAKPVTARVSGAAPGGGPATFPEPRRFSAPGAASPAGGADDPTVAAWERCVRARVVRARARLVDADVHAFAEVIARVGPPEDPEARRVFGHIASLLLRPVGTHSRDGRSYVWFPGFRAALAKIPRGDPARIRHVALAIESWRRITGRDPSEERCRADVVVETALAVPDPEAYVRHLAARGLDALAAVYHPNTLRRARGVLRGMFWDGARGGDDDPLRGVEVVRD